MALKPKEKAKELFDKFAEIMQDTWHAKDCALTTVDEIIEAIRYRTLYEVGEDATESTYVPYWQEVKQEIENL